MTTYTQKEWIQKAKNKYGGRFSYEKTKYINGYHKVIIKCKKHKKYFSVSPINFLRTDSKGNFCTKCHHNKKLTQKQFLKIATEKYDLLYDFSKSKFINTRTEVKIICPQHGAFYKKAKEVTQKIFRTLCPKCISIERSEHAFDRVKQYTKSKMGKKPGVFYKIIMTHKKTNLSFLKIGITSYTTHQRYSNIEYTDFDIEVLKEIFGTNLQVAIMEKKYKEKYSHNRIFLPRYIKFDGLTECYLLNKKIQLRHNQIKLIRDALLIKQKGICPICQQQIIMPTLDHFHTKKHGGSGKIRGVLCNACNRFLGVVENNLLRNGISFSDAPEALREMAKYVEQKEYNLIHPSEKPKDKELKKNSVKKLIKLFTKKYPSKKVPKITAYTKYKSGKKKGRERPKKLTAGIEKLYNEFALEPEFKK